MTILDEQAHDRQGIVRELHDADMSPAALFERATAAHGIRTALLSDTWQPSYDELNATANRLAHAIVAHGGAPGDRVAILMEHDAPAIAAVIAVLKAGRIVVALSRDIPPTRLQLVIEDSDPTVLVTDAINLNLAANLVSGLRAIITFEQATAAGPSHNLPIAVAADQVAVLTYTSGSTGHPKGVMKTQRQVSRSALVNCEAMEISPEDRISLFGSLSGGQAIIMMWCALLNGAALAPFSVADKGVTGLADWMIDRRINIYISSASIFRTFMKTLDSEFRFGDVRAVRLASESVTTEDFRQFRKRFTEHCMLVHTLSSSEAGNIAWGRHLFADPIPAGRLAVGRHSKGQEVFILDEHGQAVPASVAGEIVVRSRYMAAGYWRNPALTAERFIEHPDGTRTFHTGDLGRINANGMLEFLGRQDDRIKLRGNRIEPAEIEGALQRVRGVERALILTIERPNREPALVAFLTTRANFSKTPVDLRRTLRGVLPGHMVPEAYVFLEDFPVTARGKVDREKLRAHVVFVPDPHVIEVPRTETEARLADIWSDVFAISDIGRQDDFFDLGGDSLLAAVIAARVHDAFGIELNLGTFSDHPTLSKLASVVDARRRAVITEEIPLIRTPRDGPIPLSYFQERAWKASQTPEGLKGYTHASRYRLVGRLDREILRDCLNHLVERHEGLRTTFETLEGAPRQVIHPPGPASLSFFDVTAAADAERQADGLYRAAAARTFDLNALPLVHFSLIQIRDDEHWLVRVGHHIISDGWSNQMLFRELAALYAARLRGESLPSPDAEMLQYADFAVWQCKILRSDGPSYQRMIAWWRQVLADSPQPPALPFRAAVPAPSVSAALSRIGLPMVSARPPARRHPSDGVLQWEVDRKISKRLQDLGRAQRATYYMVRLAAFIALLAAETRQNDIIIGTYVTNRNHSMLQNIFGFFVNMAILRIRYEPKKSFREWLPAVRDTVLEAEAHSGIPYENLRDELLKQGVKPPDINVIFHVSRNRSSFEFGDLTFDWMDQHFDTMPWGFVMNPSDNDDRHGCRTLFDANLYDPAAVRDLVERYKHLLDAISCNPDETMEKLLMARE
jgi:amino acid adenylation domain-containing protein